MSGSHQQRENSVSIAIGLKPFGNVYGYPVSYWAVQKYVAPSKTAVNRSWYRDS